MNPTSLEKFHRWFIVPLNTLRAIPNGDGAFVALAIGCQLCERFYRAKTGTQEVPDGQPFQKEAGNSLGIGEDAFKRFWTVFRHGMQHQGSPKSYVQNGVNFKWEISGEFDAVPSEEVVDPKTSVIRIDPWKFADHIVQQFRNEPQILDGALTHAFGDIYTRPK